jgi:hypothetical protein
MCPLVTEDALVGFLQPSPKRQDLHRDGRYALHSFPPDDNEDAFVVSGHAVLVEFYLERCLWTATSGHGDWNPRHTIWRSTLGTEGPGPP